jgi:branched-chain amino acid transport system permease protein
MILPLDYLASHAVYLSVLVIFAMGVVVLYGIAGIFSLGHQGFMALGAYAAALAAFPGAGHAPGALTIGLCIASLGAAIAAAAAGGAALLGPSLRLRGDYLALATIAFAEGLRAILINSESLGGARGLDVPDLLPRATGDNRTAVLVAWAVFASGLAILCVAAVQRLARSRLGLGLRALRDDELAAGTLGLDVRSGRAVALVVAACLCGLSGWLYAHFAGHIAPRDFDFLHGALVLMYVVLGGGASATGAAAAVAAIYVLDETLKLRVFGLVNGPLGQLLIDWKDVLLAAIIVSLLIWRPYGLLHRRSSAF